MSTTTIPDYSPGAIRALHREYAVALRRTWITALALAALALALLPWQGWPIPAAWLALVAWATRGDESPGYCE